MAPDVPVEAVSSDPGYSWNPISGFFGGLFGIILLVLFIVLIVILMIGSGISGLFKAITPAKETFVAPSRPKATGPAPWSEVDDACADFPEI